jgi:hypothetical protein
MANTAARLNPYPTSSLSLPEIYKGHNPYLTTLSKQTCKCGQQHDDAEQTPLSRRRPHRRRRARRGARRVAGARGHRTVGAGGLFSPGSNASSRLHEQKKRREP